MGEKNYLRGKVKLLGVCAQPGLTTLSSAGPSGLAGGNGWRGRIYKPFPICSFRSHFLLLHPNADLLTEKCLQQMQAVTSVEVSKPWQPPQRLSPALNPLGRATWLIKCKKKTQMLFLHISVLNQDRTGGQRWAGAKGSSLSPCPICYLQTTGCYIL